MSLHIVFIRYTFDESGRDKSTVKNLVCCTVESSPPSKVVPKLTAMQQHSDPSIVD